MTNHALANSRRLEVFLQVADLQSFSLAAQRLFLTQPAVSTQIKQLEKAVGRPLVERRKPGVTLTEAGEALYAYAQRYFELVSEMESGVASSSGVIVGEAEVGATEPLEALLSDVMVDFHGVHPGVFLTVRFGSSSYVLESVIEEHLAFGLVTNDPKDARLEATPINEREMRLAVFVPVEHQVAKLKQVRPEVLERYPFVHYPRHQPGYIDDYLELLEVRPKYVMELDSTRAIQAAVGRGLGITLLTEDAPYDAAKITMVRLDAPAYKLQLFAVRSRHRNATVLERVLLEFVRSRFATPQ